MLQNFNETKKYKIKIIIHDDYTPLWEHINISQVEMRYGGSGVNCLRFWPPNFPNDKYFITDSDQNNLISKTEYAFRFKNGLLKDNIVCYELLSNC